MTMMKLFGEVRSLWAAQTPEALMKLASLVATSEGEEVAHVRDYVLTQLAHTPGAPWPMAVFRSGVWTSPAQLMLQPLREGRALLTEMIAWDGPGSSRPPRLGSPQQGMRSWERMISVFRLGLDTWPGENPPLAQGRPPSPLGAVSTMDEAHALWRAQAAQLRTWMGQIDAQGWAHEAKTLIEMVDACFEHKDVRDWDRAFGPVHSLANEIKIQIKLLLDLDVNRVTLRRRFVGCIHAAGTFEGLQAVAFSSGPISWGLTGNLHPFERALPADSLLDTEEHTRTRAALSRAVQLHNDLLSRAYTNLHTMRTA